MQKVFNLKSVLLTAALFLKRKTVCTFGNCRVSLVCADPDAAESTVMLAVHIVLAGSYIAFNRRILHNNNLLIFGEIKAFVHTVFRIYAGLGSPIILALLSSAKILFAASRL